MKVIVAGSRTFDDRQLLESTLEKMTGKLSKLTIIHGGADGADRMAEWWALRKKGVTVKGFYPDWNKHGKSAGPIRNSEMVKEADALIAFHDGKSPGTKDVIDKARKAGLKIKVVLFKPKRKK